MWNPKRLLPFVLLALPLVALSDEITDLDARLQAVAAQRGDRVAFEEAQHNPLYKEPVVSTGYLLVDDAGVLVKAVTAPEPIRMEVDGQDMRITEQGKTRRISLRKRPEVQVLFDSIRSLLTGETDALRQWFSLEYVDDGEHWSLTLTPDHERLQRELAELTVTGTGTRIHRIVQRQSDDAYSELTLLHDS